MTFLKTKLAVFPLWSWSSLCIIVPRLCSVYGWENDLVNVCHRQVLDAMQVSKEALLYDEQLSKVVQGFVHRERLPLDHLKQVLLRVSIVKE